MREEVKPEITQEMIRTAQAAMECDPAECDECVAKALAAVMTIMERDYVSRWGQIEQTLSEEMVEYPKIMAYFRDFIPRRAEIMGATVMDIDQPEVTPLRDEDGRLTGLISYRWRIRRD